MDTMDVKAEIASRSETAATVAIEIAEQDVRATFDRIMGVLSRQVRVPGFRPGRAPRQVVLSQIGGEQALQEEARSYLLEQSMGKAFEKLELPVIHVTMDEETHALPTLGQPYRYQVRCELMPSITLPDYNEIVIDQDAETISDEEIQNFVERLQDSHAIYTPVEGRAVAPDDTVILGLQSNPEGEGMPFDLTRDHFSDAIAKQLIGKTLDEHFDLVLDIPRKQKPHDADADTTPHEAESDVQGDATTDNHAETTTSELKEDAPESLAVFVQDIRHKELPELDDEFAVSLGGETWQEIEQNIRNNLQHERDTQVFHKQVDEFEEKLLALTEVEVPSSIVAEQRNNRLNRIEKDLNSDGVTMREFRKALEKDGELEDFEMDLQKAAYQDAKRDMVLGELLAQEGGKISDEELEYALMRMAQKEGMTLPKLKKELGEQGLANYTYILSRTSALHNVVRRLVNPEQDSSALENEAPNHDGEAAQAQEAEAQQA